MSGRTLALLGAVLLAGIATLALASYVRGFETRALRGVESVEAFVAKDVIAAGTSGGDAIGNGLIEQTLIPRKILADESIRSLTEIENKVAAVNIFKGEQILTSRFVTPGEVGGMLQIPADRQAMSVELTIPNGVAGFIQPGNRVSILAQIETGDAQERVQYLIQDAPVLAVGRRTVSEGDGEAARQDEQRVLVTLAISPQDAEKLAYAIFKGQVYFTLLPPDQQPVNTPGRTRDNIFS
jgi:pilus assembly protein CpaB